MIMDKGVTISFGTDASVPFFPHGKNAKELAICVELGMTSMGAIVSATKTAARTVGLGDEVGTIEAGKLADILIVDGDPLEDIGILSKKEMIKTVIKGGQIVASR